MNFSFNKSRLLQGSSMFCAFAAMLAAGPVDAQTSEEAAASIAMPEQADSGTASEGTITVTGSRLVVNGYSAPTPTTVVTSAAIAERGSATISDYLNELPQLGVGNNNRSVGFSIGGTSGASNLNLRGLGAQRTLVLLDGRRVAAASTTNAVDINLLPTNLVLRTDIVTGGASAAYGSDAVAGVVNFVLDKKFEGIKLNATNGITGEGDGHYYGADLAAGFAFGGGRGHAIFSAQYFRTNPIESASSRDWYTNYKAISNPARTATNGLPGNLAREDIGLARATAGGLILTGPLRGTSFGPGGTIVPFTFGPIQSGNIQAGGTVEDLGGYFPLLAEEEHYNFFGRASYDVSDTLTAYVEASYGHGYGENFGSPYIRQGDITISSQNPFIPAGVDMTGISSFTMGRTNEDLALNGEHAGINANTRELRRAVFGVDGSLFNDEVKWNAYYQYGQVDIHNARENNVLIANFNRAVDAVANPAVGGVAGIAAGAPICRSTLTNPANGCVALNVFGYGSPSQEAIAYVTGAAQGLMSQQHTRIKQHVAAAQVQFEPFSLWAGPVSVAAGAEYRKESYTADADAESITTSWFGGNYKPSQGGFNVKEGFVEVLVPLLRDSAVGKALDLNGAFRYTDYSISGSVKTWKVGLTYEVFSDLRLRGTRSRDIRAPSLNDFFAAGNGSFADVIDPTQAGNPSVSVRTVTGGNSNLKPEVADTLTFGGVYSPSWAPGISASVDYYDVDLQDAIVSLTGQSIINQCYGFGVPQNSAVCGAIERVSSTSLAQATIRSGGVNAQSIKVRGIDYELSYRTELGAGDLNLRAVGTQRLAYEQQLAGALTDGLGLIANQGGDGPKWRWFGTAGYRTGPSNTVLTVRYFGPGKITNEPLSSPLSTDLNRVSSVTYFDLAQNVDIAVGSRKVTFTFAVSNLFDKDPPLVVGSTSGGAAFANNGASTIHDLLGRYFRVGINARF